MRGWEELINGAGDFKGPGGTSLGAEEKHLCVAGTKDGQGYRYSKVGRGG